MKEHVRANFEASATAYDEYEARTGRFEDLADKLAAAMDKRHDRPLETVLDAGSGTGASVGPLEQRGARVVALDISRAMLTENPASGRVQADFDHLPFAPASFDAVAFTASLFLTPTPERAVAEAARVIRTGGTVGAVAPLGWSRPDGTDVFDGLERRSRSPSATDEVEAALGDAFDLRTGIWTFDTTPRNLRLFHAVPAMAARLYPRLDAQTRIENATALLADIEGLLSQRWRWMVGVRTEDADTNR
ncbi:class I SAM-dependent methyltransferase [Salinadaptatus halalkaliphilus]|uniref:Class I SAM-dependent methyltransferase n=1 Tax=Salinadaptatus halalkaliphilus TaxID=2419781 RepID=A0A4S3TIB1_9EURY|nr:methyltransferase domain-containing protein [Salinadaptatus halalkaliphilus]THE63672.1 class I SAM-dependent methyltransferase [Salinadaptatus halalkaliphilus]